MIKAVKILLGVLLLSSSLHLAACNTVAGAGQDIEAGGENISQASRNVQADM